MLNRAKEKEVIIAATAQKKTGGDNSRINEVETVATRIKRLRAAKGISQIEMIRGVNEYFERLVRKGGMSADDKPSYSRGAANQWENAGTNPNYQTVAALAEVLGVSPAYIAFGIDGPKGERKPMELVMVPEVKFGREMEREHIREWGVPADIYTKHSELHEESLDNLFLTEVTSDALAPNYVRGDRVYIDPTDKLPNGDVFAYWNGIMIAFARIDVRVGAKPMAHFPESDIDPIPLDSIEIIGRVRGKMALA